MFLSDQETAVDLLYYETIAKTVMRLIVETGERPVTIGIHGDWGAGKSSVLKMVETTAKTDKDALCLWFNGWSFEGFEDAKAVVIETIVDELRRARPADTKVLASARKVLKRVDWFKAARRAGGVAFNLTTGMPSPDQIGSIVEGAKALLAKPNDPASKEALAEVVGKTEGLLKEAEEDNVPAQMHAFREEFQTLLEDAGVRQLVVLVDDLDRCLPETAIATLEAIRLFLFVPRTAFIIAADEAMIEYSVRRHFPELPSSSGPAGYARNYLEKLIQVPFRIPALGATETHTYVLLLLAEGELGAGDTDFQMLISAAREQLKRPWEAARLGRAQVEKALGKTALPPGVDLAVRIAGQISDILTEGTRGNPRQVKRFLNALSLRYAVAEERGFADAIERPVLAKLMLAERFSPEFYDQLARTAAAAANGRSPPLGRLEDTMRGSPAPAEPENKEDKKAPRTKPAAAPEKGDWLNTEWAKAWAKVDPPLKDVDLRPYVFVARDRRSYFGPVVAAGHLEGLVERLMGQRLAAVTATEEVKKLTIVEAEQVFEAVRSRVLEADDLTKPPAGVDGLAVLVQAQPSLQIKLVSMLEGLEVTKLGAWAVSAWTGSLNDPDAKSRFEGLRAVWAEEGGAGLKAVAKASSGLRRAG